MTETGEKHETASKAKKHIFLALKVIVSVGLMGFLFSTVDVEETGNRLASTNPGLLVLAAVILLTQTVTNTLRWTSVLQAIGKPLPFLSAYRVTYIGLFFNQTLPSSVGGDAFRIYLAAKTGPRLGKAANSVLIERLMTVVVLVLLVASVQPLLFSRIPDTQAKWIFPLLALGSIAGVFLLIALENLPEKLYQWRAVQALAMLGSDAKTVFSQLRHAGLCGIWSLYGHISLSVMAFVIALSLEIDITLIDCLVLIPPVILVMTIPISMAGWGIREGAMVNLLAMVGVAESDALALSIIFGLLTVLTALPGGLVWLLSGERKSRPDSG